MSILAGCDFVLEISHAALLKQMRSTAIVGGQTLLTPFELDVPGAFGSAHLIVDNVLLDINGDDTITLSLAFSNSSVISAAKPPVALSPLSGTITINLRVVLETAELTGSLALDFAGSPVSLSLSSTSQGLLAQAAALLQKTAAQLTAELESMLRGYVQSRPKVLLPVAFPVNPAVDGVLQPPSFRTLRVRCFGPSDRNLQGIGLFGNFFADTMNAGNPASRIASAVPVGQDTLMALSLRSFRAFLWCPQLARSIGAKLERPNMQISELPGTCGTAGSIDIEDVTITNIDAFYGQGRIQANVFFKKSGTCYEASGSVVTYLRLAATGGTITPTVEPQTPNVKVDVDFWCEVAGWIGLGPGGFLLARSIEDTMEDLAREATGSAVAAMTNKSFGAPMALGMQLIGVNVTPQELSFTGRILAYQPPAPTAELSLTLEKKLAISPERREDAWVTQLWCQNRIKSYTYTETVQTQSQRFAPVAKLIALPLSVAYSVRGGNGPWLNLSDSPGSIFGGGKPFVTVQSLECRYPNPLSAGGSIVVQDVVISYATSGNKVTLFSNDGDGNFAVDLRAEVLDGSARPPQGVDPAPIISVFFESDIVVMGDEYKADLAECAAIIKATSEKYAKSRRVPRWKQHLNDFERGILDDVDFLDLIGSVRGEDIARHYRNAHGDVLGQVVAAKRAAGTVTKTTASSDQLDEQLQAIEIAIAAVRLRR